MSHFITPAKISQSVSDCIRSGLLDPETDTSTIFYDFDHLIKKAELLKKAFPESTVHSSAVKANPLIGVLKKIKEIGLLAEAASEGELDTVAQAGFNFGEIVLDSPVKTKKELAFALKNHIHINADSFMELERIAQLKTSIRSNSKIGLRINPQVGYGKILSTSLAGEYSKFGIPLKTYKREIIDYFSKYEWLSGIHMHIGSQGCAMEMLLDGIESGLKLIKDVNRNLQHHVRFIDIGGGLPVSYHHYIEPPDMRTYGTKIQELLTFYDLEDLQIITEFGRFLHANSGFIVTKVEYVKHYKESNTLMVHSGADILLRECLVPDNWYHEISLLDQDGKIKNSTNKLRYHVGGPLCFAGDIIARDLELPKAEEGDLLIIHDTGGYTFGMWSKYVSRAFPKVIGIENTKYSVLRKRDSKRDISNFWKE